MKYEEFHEDGIKLTNLQTDFIERDAYTMIHKNSVITCHDVFISCTHKGEKGVLLVRRLQHPVKNNFWPIGGRIQRGLEVESSLAKKAKDECGLHLEKIAFLGVARTFFKDEPYGHNKGTDTLNLVFHAEGVGEVNLNNAHADPLIVTEKNYNTIRPRLDSYVARFLDQLEKEGRLT